MFVCSLRALLFAGAIYGWAVDQANSAGFTMKLFPLRVLRFLGEMGKDRLDVYSLFEAAVTSTC